MKLAFSPCPNDTFTFHALVHNLIKHEFLFKKIELKDIQKLNEDAINNRPDISKISFAILPIIKDNYELLQVGAALGYGNGPKIVAEHKFSIDNLGSKTIAIPGRNTTAYALYKALCPQAKNEFFCLYHEIPELIRKKKVDCGLIIHETRFVLDKLQLINIVDLGELWESKTKLPLPLGGVVAKRSLGKEKINKITDCIRKSLNYAWSNPLASQKYILTHSQDKNPKVIKSHVDLYVNKDSLNISKAGIKAINKLFFS